MSAPVTDHAIKERVHRRLLDESGDDGHLWSRDTVRTRLGALLRDEQPLLPAARHERIVTELTREVVGFGPLEPLLADPSVTEVMVNGPGRAYVERDGRLERVDVELDASTIVRLAERAVGPLGLRLDRSSPMVDARLADGSRLHAVIEPVALDGPCLTIRRFRVRAVELDEFGVGETGVALLRWMVHAGWNVLVAGATSSGKTTLLNVLSAAIPSSERVITIEETAELRLGQPHVVRLEARPPNAEGAGAVTVRELVRTALRMRPDRIVVGEVRGAEALDMLQALNTGHDGSLSTIHANGVGDALSRLGTLALFASSGLPLDAVRAQIGSSIDAVVFVARHPGGARRVEAVAEVGADGCSARLLAEWRDGTLAAVGAPTRRGRRPDACRPDPRDAPC